MKWNVLKEKCFQPSLMFIVSGKPKRWHTCTPNTTMRQLPIDLNLHLAQSFPHFALTICGSLCMCSTQITGLFGPSLTRQTWMGCFFSVNKSPPSEVELSEYFPQLVSRPLTIRTCPSCSENKKHSVDSQWKIRTMALLKFTRHPSLASKPTN